MDIKMANPGLDQAYRKYLEVFPDYRNDVDGGWGYDQDYEESPERKPVSKEDFPFWYRRALITKNIYEEELSSGRLGAMTIYMKACMDIFLGIHRTVDHLPNIFNRPPGVQGIRRV